MRHKDKLVKERGRLIARKRKAYACAQAERLAQEATRDPSAVWKWKRAQQMGGDGAGDRPSADAFSNFWASVFEGEGLPNQVFPLPSSPPPPPRSPFFSLSLLLRGGRHLSSGSRWSESSCCSAGEGRETETEGNRGEGGERESLSARSRRRIAVDSLTVPVSSSIFASLALLSARPREVQAAGRFDAQNRLLDYAYLPRIVDKNVPRGFSAFVDLYDFAPLSERSQSYNPRDKEPSIIQFVYPSGWTLTRPSVNKNGASGTISVSTGKYETAQIYFTPNPLGPLDSVVNQPKSFFKQLVATWAAQKAEPIQSVRVAEIREKKDPILAEPYIRFSYEFVIITESGYRVPRKGEAAVHVSRSAKTLQCLFASSTDVRYFDVRDTLVEIVDSFRVYQNDQAVKAARILYENQRQDKRDEAEMGKIRTVPKEMNF
uniref:PsbP C-terminal domain-containing protein n=1 Tax=Chromera velia CCMP2878 TaxID=1169474 RepID=A0A0G4GU53_9ALVE|eukprot:Cvel_23393.t1-p1 / transcript=Cvel_23393.t1 / gene=Cvel_23393 / organism=Chromera_velia_CCMP2878 / gene_product=hypothetical protein / transcript_product=hypothetical protein / location=Cvel_scaffold2405:13063-20852(+) / protein_length=431 / sequence_SO=supercontig / SO=protein_coding / is_pseudo=false